MPDIITIGESMVMMVADQSGPLQFAGTYTRRLAGAESNVAIGLARLGHPAGWISALGDDQFGAYVCKIIRGEGVDCSRVRVLPDYPTGLMVKERTEIRDPKVCYYRKGSAASKMKPECLDGQYFKNGKILHITGIFPALSESCLETTLAAIALAKENGLLISFDPNLRLQLWTAEQARQVLLRIAALSDLVMPGKQEAELLLGTGDWKLIAERLHSLGSRYVAMKDGPAGAYYSHREQGRIQEQGYAQGFPVAKAVDTVGAGDGFAVGVLSALVESLSLREGVIRGNAIGSLAVTVQGDSEGYPTRRELDLYMESRKADNA